MNEWLQVGFARFGGQYRAGIWSGSSESWEDLALVLPTGFSQSYAQGISDDGINVYVTGFGYNLLTGREEALLWTRPIPSPGAATLLGLGGLMVARRRR